jgi:hypothetical protein
LAEDTLQVLNTAPAPHSARGPRSRGPLARILREPLLHFLILGLGLFLYFGRAAPGAGDGSRIVVSQVQVDALARQYQSTWSRPPTAQELSGLVDSFVRDEIQYREGVALGLDRDDPVIKRRVRQKLEVIAEEGLGRSAPTEAELDAYLQANPAAFRRPAVVSFEQVFFATAGPAADVERRIAAARVALERGTDPATLGEATMLPRREEKLALDLVAREFGERFAAELETLPVGTWAGPVVSGFGAHLVRVSERAPAALPPLEEVRPVVAREWENDARQRALEDDYRRLRQKYDVVIEAQLPGSPVS